MRSSVTCRRIVISSDSSQRHSQKAIANDCFDIPTGHRRRVRGTNIGQTLGLCNGPILTDRHFRPGRRSLQRTGVALVVQTKVAKTHMQIPTEVSALLAALQLQEPDTMNLQALGDPEWRRLLAFSDGSQLTLLIAQLPNDKLPNWVLERVHDNLADNALRIERIKAAYRESAEVLAKAGIEHLVIKGFTQVPEYVVDPRFRSQSDLDLFCPKEDIEAARSVLQSIGYRPLRIGTYGADHGPPLERPGSWLRRGNRFDPEMPPQIELHFCLWNEHRSLIPIQEVDLFWGRRTTRQVNGFSFPCLNPVDHLAHLSLHILRNILHRGDVIRLIRELAAFLHTHARDETFWQCWSQTHSASLRSLQAIAFFHARAWFDCQLHPQAEHAVANIPAARQSWLHRFSSSALEGMFQENKDSLWLHLTFLSQPTQKWKVIRRNLVPPVAPLGSNSVQSFRQQSTRFDAGHPGRQYVAYLLLRATSHLRANAVTLSRGLFWYLSRLS